MRLTFEILNHALYSVLTVANFEIEIGIAIEIENFSLFRQTTA